MLFNSFPFLFGFLPVALLLYFAPAWFGARRFSLIGLALASLGFYGYWKYASPIPGASAERALGYVLLLIASTTGNYFLGVLLARRRQVWLLAGGIAANLTLLGYFKYWEFGVRTLADLTGVQLPLSGFVLPLAISFYTFTQIAFIVDAHRGKATELSYWRYCLFVFFFPHLIAGPIVHHAEIMPQFAKPDATRWNSGNVSIGLAWLSMGLFKKVIIADLCAPIASAAFANSAQLTILEAWFGVLAYTMQLYFDFSGYSDMAIGLSWMFNVRLPDNFNAPYRARDIVDFWRRWHMTLSRFLRDYLYIPLGGNRHGEPRRYLNLWLTMFLGGVWHGAGWTFLLWGAYHGALLMACHLWQSKATHRFPDWLARPLTFVAVMLGWAVFRAADLGEAGRMLGALADVASFRLADFATGLQLNQMLGLVGLLILVNLAPTTKDWIESRQLDWRHAVVTSLLFCVGLLAMRDVSLNFGHSEFIYFQF